MKASPFPHVTWALSIAMKHAPLETVLLLVGQVLRHMGPPAALLALKQVVNGLVGGSGPADLTSPLLALVGLTMLTQLGGALTNFGDGCMYEKMQPATQELALRHAARLSYRHFDNPAVFDLLERNLSDTSMRVFQLIWFMIDTLTTAAGVLSAVVLVAMTSLWVALLAILIALPIVWAGSRAGARDFALNKTQSPARRFTRYISDLLSKRETANELRAYQLTGYLLGRWRESYASRKADHLRARGTTAAEGALASLGAALLFGGALAGVVYVAVQGQVAAGDIAVLVGAVRILEHGIGRMAANTGYFVQYGRPIGEFRQFLSIPAEDGPCGRGLPFPAPLSGTIRFEDVTFTYPGGTEPVLSHVTLEIQPGEHVALVGVNGAGKSTLTKLLLGLYRPDSGRITIDGIDLHDIAPESLVSHVSCVFQDFVRYQMTLRENVAMGKLGAPPERVEEALAAAGLDALPQRLPHGYDTLLGRYFSGGVDLSGGQWQRVALARAFVRDAELIVLDEPTSALDPRAELEVFGRFVELVRNKTALLISHRLGSARVADRVIVLDGGAVAETGSHEQLMAAGGIYAELFKTQAQWYEAGAPSAAAEMEAV